MFRRKSSPSIELTKLSSLIAPGVEIMGDVVITDGLRVDGYVEGNVRCKQGAKGLLVLSEKGAIRGGVQVHDAVVNGTICGDLEVAHFLELQAGARVTGNITYRQLRMDCGATVDGKLERIAEGESDRAAPADNVVPLPRLSSGAAAGADRAD
jgi:cytoskeletal protein CcmA (bactofilin family)